MQIKVCLPLWRSKKYCFRQWQYDGTTRTERPDIGIPTVCITFTATSTGWDLGAQLCSRVEVQSFSTPYTIEGWSQSSGCGWILVEWKKAYLFSQHHWYAIPTTFFVWAIRTHDLQIGRLANWFQLVSSSTCNVHKKGWAFGGEVPFASSTLCISASFAMAKITDQSSL